MASHSPYWMPGPTLKKIAIAEMRHAEAIAERVVVLGGEPTTRPEAITIGTTAEDMLQNDLGQEKMAIELYGRIISLARHHRVFARACRRLTLAVTGRGDAPEPS